jgi:DNA helicase II / ATP-dependent DNA helicase PcrA
MPSPENRAIVAVAGACKTQTVIDEALADPSRRVLITTYTNENLRQITARIQALAGVVPENVDITSWYTFLLRDGIRPYQHSVLGDIGVVRGLNFEGQKQRFARKTERRYFLDGNGDVFRDGLADFACMADANSGGAVIARLEMLYDHIYVDEVQDLVGYDLDVLDLLFASKMSVTVVGDPRQHTLATANVPKNKRYRGAGFSDWLDERSDICAREDRLTSVRCNQPICDFASGLFPDLPGLEAAQATMTGHDGVFFIKPFDVQEYYEEQKPVVLRDRRTTDTLGLPAMNIGVAKGSTFDRVLIFPTSPMRQFLDDSDASKLKAPERLYVAVTRARHSVAFVVPR